MRRQFIPELEALRGLAAAAVIIGHWFLFCVTPYFSGWPGSGGIKAALFWTFYTILEPQPALLVFFIVSGVALGIQLAQIPVTGPRSYLGFAIRRALRLWPAMWLAVFISYLIAGKLNMARPPDIIWKTGFFLDYAINVPLWSLLPEVLGSALMPAMVWLFHKLNPVGHAIVIVCLSALTFLSQAGLPQPWTFLVFFYLGLVVGNYSDHLAAMIPKGSKGLFLVLAVILYLLAPQFPLIGPTNLSNWGGWMFSEIAPCFVIVCAAYVGLPKWFGSFLRHAWIRFFGRVTFSFYVLHLPILLLVQLYGVGPPGSLLFAMFREFGVLAVAIGVTLLAATASYEIIEKPFIRMGRRIHESLAAPRAAHPAAGRP